MIPATILHTLKLYVEKTVLHGDFLVSTNRLSEVWISELNTEEFRKLVRDTLVGFWRKYLENNEDTYFLVSIEQFEETAGNTFSTSTVTKEVVDIVNNSRLRFEKVLVDPDSFEVFIEECPKGSPIMMFAEPSVQHDLLVAACKNLRALGYTVKGIITPVENEQNSETEIQNELQIHLIPFIVYNKQGDKLSTIMEKREEPYIQYHPYFSS
jgi:hypothetical protein